MFDDAKGEVKEWLNRSIDAYYPIVYIDATFISTRRIDSVSKAAYYTLLGVKSDETREVLGVYNFPTSAVQLGVIHLQRSILKWVQPKHKAEVAQDFKNVFRTDARSDTKEAVEKRYVAFLSRWSDDCPS